MGLIITRRMLIIGGVRLSEVNKCMGLISQMPVYHDSGKDVLLKPGLLLHNSLRLQSTTTVACIRCSVLSLFTERCAVEPRNSTIGEGVRVLTSSARQEGVRELSLDQQRRGGSEIVQVQCRRRGTQLPTYHAGEYLSEAIQPHSSRQSQLSC